MDKQFTASEVRRQAKELFAHNAVHQRAMLNAFADLLEAQEKAVPVAFRYLSQQSSTLAWVWSGWLDLGDRGISALHVHCKTSGDTKIEYAYAHPNSSDTERLAEALQEILDYRGGAANALEDEYVVDRAHQALAAHSAQAQPPAASVPGVSAQAHEKAQAALAAQENPNG